jgi:hypothetical protein
MGDTHEKSSPIPAWVRRGGIRWAAPTGKKVGSGWYKFHAETGVHGLSRFAGPVQTECPFPGAADAKVYVDGVHRAAVLSGRVAYSIRG